MRIKMIFKLPVRNAVHEMSRRDAPLPVEFLEWRVKNG